MTLNRRIGLGFTLAVDASGGSSFTTLGSIVDGLKEEQAKAEMVDTSVLADLYKTKSKSQIDPGGFTLMIAYDPDDATTTALVAIFKNTSAVPPNWRISYPSGTQGAGIVQTETFKAHLSAMGREIVRDKMITCEITLTKTGTIGYNGE
jgi:hypothetical protein